MVFANVRELKNKTSALLRLAQKEDIIVTSRGKPRAILHRLLEEDLEDYLLENSPAFLHALEKAHIGALKGRSITLDQYARKRGIRH